MPAKKKEKKEESIFDKLYFHPEAKIFVFSLMK